MASSGREMFRAWSQFWNATFGGSADVTFSTRCYMERGRQPFTFLRRAVNAIFWKAKDHCKAAWKNDLRVSKETTKYLEKEKR